MYLLVCACHVTCSVSLFMCAICLCIHGMGMCICVYVHRLVCTWNRCMFAGECYTSLCVAGVSGMFVCNVCVCVAYACVCSQISRNQPPTQGEVYTMARLTQDWARILNTMMVSGLETFKLLKVINIRLYFYFQRKLL